jgi:hypothetical protein
MLPTTPPAIAPVWFDEELVLEFEAGEENDGGGDDDVIGSD